jgi:hypothetical protein
MSIIYSSSFSLPFPVLLLSLVATIWTSRLAPKPLKMLPPYFPGCYKRKTVAGLSWYFIWRFLLEQHLCVPVCLAVRHSVFLSVLFSRVPSSHSSSIKVWILIFGFFNTYVISVHIYYLLQTFKLITVTRLLKC